MITGFAIENFKGIRERVELDLRPLTLIFGANSAGKSTVMHALHYAVELLERHNANSDQTVVGGDSVELGGFANFVHGHDLNRVVWLKFTVTKDDDLFTDLNDDVLSAGTNEHLMLSEINSSANSFGASDEAAVEIGVSWDLAKHRAHISHYRLYYQDELLSEVVSEAGGKRVYLSQLNLSHPILTTFEGWEMRSDKEKEERPISEIYPNPQESCLSFCLRDSLEFFLRIDGPTTSSRSTSPILLIENQECALPEPGQPFVFAMKDIDDILPPMEWDDAISFGEQIDSILKYGEGEEREEKRRLHSLAKETAEGISLLLTIPLNIIRKHLSQFRYLGPIREVPARHHTAQGYDERVRWASGLSAWDRLETDDDLIENVSQWLGDENRLNSGYHLRLKRYKELDLADPLIIQLLTGRAFDDAEADARIDLSKVPTHSRILIVPVSGTVELRPSDVGIGISQVVPVIVTALDGRNKTIGIEQPELHLHPRLQASIADLFIEAIVKNGHRFIIETHSEHFILRLLRRIRETTAGNAPLDQDLKTNDLAIYYLKQKDGGTCQARIDVDVKGEFIQPWPDDFFEIDFYERFG
jgi:hypothetical protein